MTFSNFPDHEARSRSAERVAAWKEHVQLFFNNDWCRVRTLIMELEAGSWNNGDAEPVMAQEKQKPVNDQPLSAFSGSGIQNSHGKNDSEQLPPVRDRLTQLAEQIERKLQTANAIER